MRFARRTFVVGVSLVCFIFMLPLELIQTAVRGLAGKHKSRVSIVSELYAEVFCGVDEALSMLLPGAADIKEEVKALAPELKSAVQKNAGVEFDPQFDKELHFYVSKEGTAVLDTVKGKWGPIKFMMAFDKEGKIKDIVVLELTERRGKPVKDRKFLDQYIGKSTADPIKLKKDIKGIAGATISSRQMTDGIRKLLYIYEELYRK